MLTCNTNTEANSHGFTTIAELEAYQLDQCLSELSNDYNIDSVLGRGACSVVYKALDVARNVTVALKMIPKRRLIGKMDQVQSIIEKEIAMMASLDHPYIVRLLRHHVTSTHIVIVTEYVAGGELFHQIVKLKSLPENVARRVITQVASGLSYLHLERGIVHRDLKLENLLFEAYVPSSEGNDADLIACGIGNVKIADFGLAKVIFDSSTHTPCGTFEYTAPEIFQHQFYSKSVDLWALGCVLYTLLVGFPPFYGESPMVIAAKVRMGKFQFQSPWWDNISNEAKDLIRRLLEVDPVKRLDITQFMEHPWINGLKMDSTSFFKPPLFSRVGLNINPRLSRPLREQWPDLNDRVLASPVLTSPVFPMSPGFDKLRVPNNTPTSSFHGSKKLELSLTDLSDAVAKGCESQGLMIQDVFEMDDVPLENQVLDELTALSV